MAATKHGTVTRSALLRRINRRLGAQNEEAIAAGTAQRLSACSRTSPSWHTLGDYHLMNIGHKIVVETHVDIEALGRQIGAMLEYESLAE